MYVNASIIGELALGELPEWHVGVCTLTYEDNDPYAEIHIRGENELRVVVCDNHVRNGILDLERTAELTNLAIESIQMSL